MGWSHNCSAQAENINNRLSKEKTLHQSLPRRHFRRIDGVWWANQSSYAVDSMFTLWLFRGFLILSCISFEALDRSPLWTRQVSSSDFNNSQNNSTWLIWKEKKKKERKKILFICEKSKALKNSLSLWVQQPISKWKKPAITLEAPVCVSMCVRTTGRNRGDNAANQCCSLASLPAVLCLWISAAEMKFSNFSETAEELQD